MGRLLALDGTNLAHRFHHALKSTDMRDNTNQPTWVANGMLSMVVKLIDTFRPSSLLLAFDSHGGCPSRRELAPSYKQGRASPDPDLLVQLDTLPNLFSSAGFCSVQVPDWEADDILASAAAQAASANASCVVVSSDKDVHQLISPNCMVRKPEGPLFSEADLVKKWGVPPNRWVEYAALCGEAADNLDGVPGIGPKRAVQLLDSFTDVEDAITDPSAAAGVLGDRLASSLLANVEKFRRNRIVGTLRTDLSFSLEGVKLGSLDTSLVESVFAHASPQQTIKLVNALDSLSSEV